MNTVLLLVDVQRALLLPPTPVPSAGVVSFAIEDLLRRARESGAQVIHLRDRGAGAGELVHEAGPGEPVVDHHAPDAFAGSALAALIPRGADVVLAGTRSELSVGATALAALHRGHHVTLVRGAHATYDGELPAAVVGRQVEKGLRGAGVSVLDREAVSFVRRCRAASSGRPGAAAR